MGIFCIVSYQKLALGLTTATLAVGSEVLPEERVVDVATAVEVEQRGLGSGGLQVALGLSIAKSLDGSVEAVDVCLVVLGVVKLHDLAGDVGLECAVVIWRLRRTLSLVFHIRCGMKSSICGHGRGVCFEDLQGRSGRVALPRVKLVVAMAARGFAARARRPARRRGVVRRSEEDIAAAVVVCEAIRR
jgi:hypothetical protein